MYTVLVLLLATMVAGQYDYSEVIHKSILFYEAQRAGALPDDNRVPWRADSVLTDGQNESAPLSGGWFDAGDHVKFGFPMASTVTVLAYGMIMFEDGYRAAGEWENALDCIRWPLDYFMDANELASGGDRFFGQVGDGHEDHAYWGRPEDLDMYRPAWYLSEDGPGSDLAGETAAALAASSIVFRSSDPSYADQLLEHARVLYDFAYDHRGIYSDTITNARDFYNSFSGYQDELCWGGAWMYEATEEQVYLDKAYEFAERWPGDRFSWDDKQGGCHLLLYKITGNGELHIPPVTQLLTAWFPGGWIPYTPMGLAWVDMWGPNRYSANMAFLALIAAEYGIQVDTGRNFAKSQIDYMLGDGPRSFVVGFGENPPHSVHHRAASCPDMPAPCGWDEYESPEVNPQILDGALAGGPGQDDSFEDDRTDYVKNEVATDYNSGFQGALAGLESLRIRGLL